MWHLTCALYDVRSEKVAVHWAQFSVTSPLDRLSRLLLLLQHRKYRYISVKFGREQEARLKGC